MNKKSNKMKQLTVPSTIVMTITGIFIAIFCISLLVPLVWCLYASFKGTLDYAIDPFSLPDKLHFENYPNVFEKLVITASTKHGVVKFNVFALTYHSILYAVGIPLIHVFFVMLMGYVMARYKTIFSRCLYNFGIVLMMVQLVGTLPSAMQLNKAIGRYDNLVFYILTSCSGCFYGMEFLLFYGQFKGFSNAYAEAAEIDGAGHYTILWKIYLPMSLPLFAVQFVLGFIGKWNDYSIPLIWMPSYPNLTYGLYLFQAQAPTYGATQPELLAGFIICMIPSMILYLGMQKSIVEKIQIGGLKG